MKSTSLEANGHSSGVIDLVSGLARQYGISSIDPLLESYHAVATQDEISIAVLGRFKAGKSSFLNHLLQRKLLPVGVIPVTTIVTEIVYGPVEMAMVHFLDGRIEKLPVDAISRFVSESENPDNQRQVSRVTVELPMLKRFSGLRFVDTPGLQSVLTHNTRASSDWLPNVGLALVAISVDTPLSQQDVDLIAELHQYTPKVAILLTKADLLSDSERDEVALFIGRQLTKAFDSTPPIFAYSVRTGYEHFKANLEDAFVAGTLSEFQERKSDILQRKLQTALRECEQYLTLTLTSAQMIGSDREALRAQLIGDTNFVDDVKSQLHLVVRHAMGGTRTAIAKILEGHQYDLQKGLAERLECEFQNWTRNLNQTLTSFEIWLRLSLSEKLAVISASDRTEFVAGLDRNRSSAYCKALEISFQKERFGHSEFLYELRKLRYGSKNHRARMYASAGCLTGTGSFFHQLSRGHWRSNSSRGISPGGLRIWLR
jgi:GTP-binding protein EngB required for normal cell division